ncbi:MAG: M56 family metallopeptidase, partial [Terriglobales bacterium]
MMATLAAALIHFLWQAALVALALAGLQPWLRTPRARYAAACVALLALPAVFAITLMQMGGTGAGTAAAGLLPAAFAPWLVGAWMLGALACATHAAAGWALAQRLRRKVSTAVPEAWQAALVQLCCRLGLRRRVRLGMSATAAGPCVLGWLRPVVLLPASALANLSLEQLEAVLAHELAHIRRNDYLVTLVQRCVESLFFF